MYKIVTAGTLMSFRQSVQDAFDDGWDWVDGGGSVSAMPGSVGRMGKAVGGFWAIVEIERCCAEGDTECDCVTTTDKTQEAGLTVDEVALIMERAMREGANHVV